MNEGEIPEEFVVMAKKIVINRIFSFKPIFRYLVDLNSLHITISFFSFL